MASDGEHVPRLSDGSEFELLALRHLDRLTTAAEDALLQRELQQRPELRQAFVRLAAQHGVLAEMGGRAVVSAEQAVDRPDDRNLARVTRKVRRIPVWVPWAVAASAAALFGVWRLGYGREPGGAAWRVVEVAGECYVTALEAEPRHGRGGDPVADAGRRREARVVAGMEVRRGDCVTATSGGRVRLQSGGGKTTVELYDAVAEFSATADAGSLRLRSGRLTGAAAPRKQPLRIGTEQGICEVANALFRLETAGDETWMEVQTGRGTLIQGGQRIEIGPDEVAVATAAGRMWRQEPFRYLVVDLAGGPAASGYPVTCLREVPPGGWTEEHKTTKLVLRRIPGTDPDFVMGSPSNTASHNADGRLRQRGELGRSADETEHRVKLTKAFYMGVFEVTQRQWELVMGNRPSYFHHAAYYAARPVERVSYHEIRENPLPVGDKDGRHMDTCKGSRITPNWPSSRQAHPDSFMGRLRAKTGLAGFDLPTEAQWEYACRAGTTTALNSGHDLTVIPLRVGDAAYGYWTHEPDPRLNEVGRYMSNGGEIGTNYASLYPPHPDCAPEHGTAVVGSYRPNDWGLYDMHGNVAEWCLDYYGGYPARAVTDPVGPGWTPAREGDTSQPGRVFRGGNLFLGSDRCRSAARCSCDPSTVVCELGFRAVYRPSELW